VIADRFDAADASRKINEEERERANDRWALAA
jgi:hypothetical protein